MLRISHRGNLSGPNPLKENTVKQIKLVLDLGLDVEVDVRLIDKELYLGHDAPQEKFPDELLNNEHIWFHCKNLEAFSKLKGVHPHVFYHQKDPYALISNGLVWSYNAKTINAQCVVMVEDRWDLANLPDGVFGVCTDFPFYEKLPNGKVVFCFREDAQNVRQSVKDFYELYQPLIKSEDFWALDIGAACGDSSIVIASCLNSNSRVICFEAGREIIKMLHYNLQSAVGCYDVFNVAASNKYGKETFISNYSNGGIILPEFKDVRGQREDDKGYEVETVHTGQFLSSKYTTDELAKIKFIKIDCEGYDYVILDGLTDIINKNKPIIVVEWWQQKAVSDKLFDVIKKLNYTPYNAKGEIVDSSYILLKYTHDLILRPNE